MGGVPARLIKKDLLMTSLLHYKPQSGWFGEKRNLKNVLVHLMMFINLLRNWMILIKELARLEDI